MGSLYRRKAARIVNCKGTYSLQLSCCSDGIYIVSHARRARAKGVGSKATGMHMQRIQPRQAAARPALPTGLLAGGAPLRMPCFRSGGAAQGRHASIPPSNATTYARDVSTAPRLIQHKNEAFWFYRCGPVHDPLRYRPIWRHFHTTTVAVLLADPPEHTRPTRRFLSIVYDHIVNPGHWTEGSRIGKALQSFLFCCQASL